MPTSSNQASSAATCTNNTLFLIVVYDIPKHNMYKIRSLTRALHHCPPPQARSAQLFRRILGGSDCMFWSSTEKQKHNFLIQEFLYDECTFSNIPTHMYHHVTGS